MLNYTPETVKVVVVRGRGWWWKVSRVDTGEYSWMFFRYDLMTSTGIVKYVFCKFMKFSLQYQIYYQVSSIKFIIKFYINYHNCLWERDNQYFVQYPTYSLILQHRIQLIPSWHYIVMGKKLMFASHSHITTNSRLILGISTTSFQGKTTTSVITVSGESKHFFAMVVLKEKERNG